MRWCLFTEPVNLYSGSTVKLAAVLSNLDALRSGEYPIRVEVIAPDGHRVFEEQLTLEIPDPSGADEPPLVREVFLAKYRSVGPQVITNSWSSSSEALQRPERRAISKSLILRRCRRWIGR